MDPLPRLRSLHRRVGNARCATPRAAASRRYPVPDHDLHARTDRAGVLLRDSHGEDARGQHGTRMISELRHRDPLLFWTGATMLLVLVVVVLISIGDTRQILGLNPWIKPMK